MELKTATKLFIGLTIIAIAVYDVWVISSGGNTKSISWTIWENSAGNCSAGIKAKPMIPAVAGILFGHLFWQMIPDKVKRK
jgi:hypothetical protein